MSASNRRDDLSALMHGLDSEQVDILIEMAHAMAAGIRQEIASDSDLLSPAFNTSFSNRLIVHHATHDEKFSKKAFEFAFHKAATAAGKSSRIVSNPTNPGADLVVDGVAFSLKTEGGQRISRTSIVISKLMEARWIRECGGPEDFASCVSERIVGHLSHYSRIVVLRAFSEIGAVSYELIEVPVDLLRTMADLKPSDFSSRTVNGSSAAIVHIGEKRAFLLKLDGSVEKVTIAGLASDLCRFHGRWTIPVPPG